MNNIKINSYSLKKNPSGLSASTIPASSLSSVPQSQSTERKKENFQIEKEKNSLLSNLHSNLINEVNKIIKTPSLNISSKLDSKGNRSININFFDKQVKNKIESKNSKDSKAIEQELMSDTKNPQPEIPEEREEKNINIKLSINSEVINNNIRINNNNKNSSSTTKANSNENVGNFNEIKASLNYYKGLVSEKDKQIEELTLEINKLKGQVTFNSNHERSNSNTIINSPMIINKQNNFVTTTTPFNAETNTPSFKLDLKNRLSLGKEKVANNDLCSERTSHNNSIISKALGVNSNKISNENVSGSQTSNYLIDNLKGKTLHTPNYFRKSNISSINNINKNSSFGTLGAPEKVNFSVNQNYKTNFENTTLSPKAKEFKPINEVLQSTIQKLEDSKKKESNLEQNKISFPISSISSNNYNNPNSSENVTLKLNLLKNRTSKLLKFYSDFVIKNHKL